LLVKQQGKRGEMTQPGPACRTQTDHHAIDCRMLCSWCSANRPLSFTSVSTLPSPVSHTTVYPYFSPVSPDVDICCIAGWRGGTRAQIISYRVSYPKKYWANIHTIRPNMANIAQYPISQYQYRSNPIFPTRPVCFISNIKAMLRQ